MEFRNTLAAGTRLRHYRIEKVIGQGGFGITYLAFDTELQRKVAIKECYPRDFVVREGTTVVSSSPLAQKDYDWALGKFMNEATTLARFKHPGIVQVLQILKEENNTAYMVLEYVEGRSLDRWVKSLPAVPSQGQLLAIAEPLLDALETIHRENLVHRDIAPDNIYIRTSGEAVLLDFGAARQTTGQHSKSLNLVVKDGYSAPEQYYAEGRQGPWTDIYAFAATLYRCIAGARPPDAMARLDAINNNDPDPLAPLAAEGYSPRFLDAIMAGLAPQVKYRPGSVADWRRQFSQPAVRPENVVSRDGAAGAEGVAKPAAGKPAAPKPVTVKPVTPRPVTPKPVPAEPERVAAPEAAVTPVQPAGRRRFPMLAAAAVLVAPLVVGGVYLIYEDLRLAAETRSWSEATANDAAGDYQAFLADHPGSALAQEARRALERLSGPWSVRPAGTSPGGAQGIAPVGDGLAVAGYEDFDLRPGREAVVYRLSRGGKTLWRAAFGDTGDNVFHAVTALDDGGLVAAGEGDAAAGGGRTAVVARFSATGETVWTRRFGGAGDSRLLAVGRLSSGNLVAAGATGKDAGSALGWLLTLTPQGELVSERTFDPAGGGEFSSVIETAGGGLVLAGGTSASDGGDANFWIVRLDADGEVVFDRQTGGKGRERINGVARGGGGEFVLAGETTSFGANRSSAILLRLTAENKTPPRIFPGEGGGNAFLAIAPGPADTLLVAGSSAAAPSAPARGWIMKLSADLDTVVWRKRLADGPVRAVAALSDGTIVAAGAQSGEARAPAVFWVERFLEDIAGAGG